MSRFSEAIAYENGERAGRRALAQEIDDWMVKTATKDSNTRLRELCDWMNKEVKIK